MTKNGNRFHRVMVLLVAALLTLVCVSEAASRPLQAGSTAVQSADDGLRAESENAWEAEIETILAQMTLAEKAAQLFVVTPEAIMGVDCVTKAGELSESAIDTWPVGGLIFFADNLVSVEQTQEMLAGFQSYSLDRIGLPLFLCVDEEGGSVARVANNAAFGAVNVGNMSAIGATGDTERAYLAGAAIGTYLKDLGFNLDFAPVADVWSNPSNTVVKYRAFGSDPELVADMAAALLGGLEDAGVYGTYKHFPGHGNTTADTHDGYAYSEKTLAELMACEFLPFVKGIEEGVSFIMAAHIALPNVTGDDTPASMSPVILGLLRGALGYDGIIITDALNMGAITEDYTSAEAAVTALQAGADLLLMPEDFAEAYSGVLQAVADGSLTEERIDESLRRILRVKLEMGK